MSKPLILSKETEQLLLFISRQNENSKLVYYLLTLELKYVFYSAMATHFVRMF